jgi:GR25 family glycosyltransferase involved in LPS biosynthesis
VLGQTEPADIVVVLDGPDSCAEAILSAYEGVRVARLASRGGAPAARNAGLALAETDYVLFLDADDYLEGPLLASAVGAAGAAAADLVFGRFVYALPNGERIAADQPYVDAPATCEDVLRYWLSGRFTPPCAVLWRTAFVRALGGWDETLLKNQDGDLIHRALLRGAALAAAADGQGVYVQHDHLHRVSLQNGRGQLESLLRVLDKVLGWSEPGACAWKGELGGAYDRLAQKAFDAGQDDIGRAATAGARRCMGRIPRGFYINLDRSQDRRTQVETELVKLRAAGHYQRFAAVDGHRLTSHPEIGRRAELGCLLSHMEILRRNIGLDGWLHLMEDDVLVSRHAATAVHVLTSQPDYQAFDLIFTNAMVRRPFGQVAGLRALFDRSVTAAESGEVRSVDTLTVVPLRDVDFGLTTSYLVNPRAIERIANLLARRLDTGPFTPIDSLYSELSQSGELSAGCTIPFFTLPRPTGASTILGDIDPWQIPLRIMEAALYADRDVPALQGLLRELERSAPASVTSDLIAGAYRQLLNRA